jgi:hypothetical protein
VIRVLSDGRPKGSNHRLDEERLPPPSNFPTVSHSPIHPAEHDESRRQLGYTDVTRVALEVSSLHPPTRSLG